MAKHRIARTRNNGSQTEAAFWGWIRSALRQRSRYWKPIQECKKLARRAYKGTGKQKFEYQCNLCKKWWADKEIEVDHIDEAGSLKSGDDLKGFVERLFCEVDGLQLLCKGCHNKKTFKKK